MCQERRHMFLLSSKPEYGPKIELKSKEFLCIKKYFKYFSQMSNQTPGYLKQMQSTYYYKKLPVLL